MKAKPLLLILTTMMLTACWNGGSHRVHLGDVSVGQQMIDLKNALDAGAMSQAEYDSMKQTFLSLNTICGAMSEEDLEDT